METRPVEIRHSVTISCASTPRDTLTITQRQDGFSLRFQPGDGTGFTIETGVIRSWRQLMSFLDSDGESITAEGGHLEIDNGDLSGRTPGDPGKQLWVLGAASTLRGALWFLTNPAVTFHCEHEPTGLVRVTQQTRDHVYGPGA